jgi:hypothetical protein
VDALTFATELLGRGIEFVVRKSGRLGVWPNTAWKIGLTDAERDFIRTHRAELIAIAAAKTLPEATVQWQPPQPGTPTVPPPPACPFCGRKCVGPGNALFKVLHWSSEEERERRRAEATRVMLKMMGQPFQEPL